MQLSFQDTDHRISRIIAVVLIVCGIAMIAVYAIEGAEGPLHHAQQGIHAIMAPVERVGAGIGQVEQTAEDAVADATADEATLSALRERNAELTQLLTQAEEYRLESERLRGLLELKDIYKLEGVSARVIGRSTDAWNQTITLDVGEEEGVAKGLTVMGPSGVIGQVVAVSASSCTVRLLSDPNSGVAAQIQSSRVQGIVRGSLTGALHLENVDADAQVNQGDVVLTSGLGGSFTKGLLIGTVVRVEGNAKDGTRVIVVAPNEEADALEEVTVVFSASESARIIRKDAADGSNGPSDQTGSSASAEGDGSSSGGTASSDAPSESSAAQTTRDAQGGDGA